MIARPYGVFLARLTKPHTHRNAFALNMNLKIPKIKQAAALLQFSRLPQPCKGRFHTARQIDWNI